MKNSKMEAIAAISLAMNEMTDAFNALKTTILDSNNYLAGAILCPQTGTEIGGDIRENLIKAFGDWNIHSSSTAGEVVRYVGYFAASDPIACSVERFNTAKEILTSTSMSLSAQGITEREMRSAYAKAGFPVIHPLQARRTIKVIDAENLQHISFSIAKNIESIERLPVQKARERLEKAEADDILAMLVNLDPNDTVRWHKPVATHIRANIVHKSEEHGRQSKMIHASLPIIIKGSQQLPKIIFNQPKNSRTRKTRSDTASNNKIALPFINDGYLSFGV